MVGAMVASNVSLSTPLTLNFGDVPFELQSAFDMIMPGFLPLIAFTAGHRTGRVRTSKPTGLLSG